MCSVNGARVGANWTVASTGFVSNVFASVANLSPIPAGMPWQTLFVQILLIELGIVWIELVSTGFRYGTTSESSRSRSTWVGCASAYASACFVP